MLAAAAASEQGKQGQSIESARHRRSSNEKMRTRPRKQAGGMIQGSDTAADRHGREAPGIDPGSEGGGTTRGVTPGIGGTPGSDPGGGVIALTAEGAIASTIGDTALTHRIHQPALPLLPLAQALAKGDAGMATVKSAPTPADPV
ncbi:hypothetical protein FGO68_gene15485 [Halteria grandinella]|uniref:Uncharacterized protein n=1 Tax=Halteria grandinella TaxID=5974 RepID=A0A8J8T2I5_HALGN|nr:hypothetical protein FGO68_gene15485 [Halteria grandinella]